MLTKAITRLPPDVIRMFGRVEKRAPTVGPIIRRFVRSVQTEDGVIGHGEGAGLRFNPAGANPGYVFGTTEPLMQQKVAELLGPGLVFYDIGANVGFFSLIAARTVGASGAVYAFEPLAANADALAHNIAINGFENVELVRAAVASEPGRAVLAETASSVQAHLADFDTGVPTVATALVDVTSVDAAVRSGLRPPDVAKIDVEGAEVAVLEGMRETLAEHRPRLLCELHGTAAAFCAFFDAFPYRLRSLDPIEGPLRSFEGNLHVVCEPVDATGSGFSAAPPGVA